MSQESEAAAIDLIKRWFIAYNTEHAAGHLDLVEFPLVGFGGGREGRENLAVQVRQDGRGWTDVPGEGVAHREPQWVFTTLDHTQVRHATDRKSHLLATFSRCRADGTAYGTGVDRLQIAINGEQGWRIRALSSCGLREPGHLDEPDDPALVESASTVVENVIRALNERDLGTFRSLLHFPFVRIPGDEIQVIDAPDEVTIGEPTDGWARSEIAALEVLTPQSSDKVVVDVEIRRFDSNGRELEPEGGILLVTRHGSDWGLQLSSTRAGLAGMP